MIDVEVLKGFCHPGQHVNQCLAAPFTVDGFTYATDGLIMIRVPEIEVAAVEYHPDPVKVWNEIWEIPVFKWGPGSLDGVVLETKVCQWCKGKGYLGRKKDADVCDGCDGKGAVPTFSESSRIFLGANMICGWRMSQILKAFPDAVFDLEDRGVQGIPWKADGVEGVVMPLRIPKKHGNYGGDYKPKRMIPVSGDGAGFMSADER